MFRLANGPSRIGTTGRGWEILGKCLPMRCAVCNFSSDTRCKGEEPESIAAPPANQEAQTRVGPSFLMEPIIPHAKSKKPKKKVTDRTKQKRKSSSWLDEKEKKGAQKQATALFHDLAFKRS
ncbi:hypothetical protein TWF569_006998 [Orbilia oligospora]|nr:hypothetical protein TWF569_006998 [Orbilia oligospora]